MNTNPVSNVARVRSLYEAFGRGDIQAVLGAMDPKIQWRQAEGNPYEPTGKAWTGPDEIMQKLFVRLATEWDAFTVHPKEFHDAGATVVVEVRYTGTYKKTGKRLDAQVCHVFRVQEGKLASFQQFMDTAHVQDVMGAR